MENKLTLKFLILSILIFCTLLFPLPKTTLATTNIQVFLDELPLSFEVPPLLEQDRTLVPFRLIAQRLHLKVNWEEKNQTIEATTPTTSLLLKIGQSTALVNGQPVELEVPPKIIDGRTLVPLRFFSENLGCTVKWFPQEYIIKIKSPPQQIPITGFYALGGGQTSSWQNLFKQEYPQTEKGYTDLIGKIALGWYSLDENGNLLTKSTTGWQRPQGWEKVLEAAQKYNLTTEMVVHMTDQKSQLSKLIAQPFSRKKAVEKISQTALFYDGVNLDLEGLGWRESGETLEQTRANFTLFVKMLYEQLTAENLSLTLTLHAPNSAYPGYDYARLGQYCNAIIIMAYDYGPKPEPNELVTIAIEQALEVVPATKLILGLSLPSENPTSLTSKIGLVKSYQLQGLALWRLGLVTEEMWQVFASNILPRN